MQTLRPEVSILVDEGGRSQGLPITTAASAASEIIGYEAVLVSPTVACFMRQGADPTATNDGTDIYLAAGNTYRVHMKVGNKLAFRAATENGTVYMTPGA